ncbi:prepilin-type N-terminal cleavage/methylation domain-containing protein [Ferrimonas sp. SCSIO 43195]|uniref:prepilin-type N-terminal cleavage/methylation domain-containing protein n=1 Tax=Ferrimonas sp. SCSIO 43195 TaxID=2822844 RepID=UPI002074F6A0|nr:prepilin-type N-terminal cleavage/methylation domain-containing protein [Ferrimonas sp. SCSIO 43195]USD37277.1 prepilin-type N-terminal cleavage/methylation domain-containing protein [Ferrimonas sp. SCSIO 43195]
MKKQSGFSLVELVIVVVVLGLLAAVALPRFINITDEAEDAASEGVAGGFASAIGITRAQWEVEGRPADGSVVLSGQTVFVNDYGYPSGTSGRAPTAMTAGRCLTAFNQVLQAPPRLELLSSSDLDEARYAVDVSDGTGGEIVVPGGTNVTALDECIYVQTATLDMTNLPAALSRTTGKGFVYNPGTGQVVTFTN